MKQKDLEKDSLPVIAKISDKDKTSREILNTIFLTSQITGKNVPLTQIAAIQTQTSLNQIIRRNSQRTITVGCYVADGYNTASVMEKVEKSMEGLQQLWAPMATAVIFGMILSTVLTMIVIPCSYAMIAYSRANRNKLIIKLKRFCSLFYEQNLFYCR